MLRMNSLFALRGFSLEKKFSFGCHCEEDGIGITCHSEPKAKNPLTYFVHCYSLQDITGFFASLLRNYAQNDSRIVYSMTIKVN